jgi:hypothetical protein
LPVNDSPAAKRAECTEVATIAQTELTEAQIEGALVRATLEGRLELAEELRALLVRRRHAAAGNVVELAAEGRGHPPRKPRGRGE